MSKAPWNPVPGWDAPRDYYAPDEPTADEDNFDEMVEERMSYPHQPGSPYFEGGEAYEAYCDDIERMHAALREALAALKEARLFVDDGPSAPLAQLALAAKIDGAIAKAEATALTPRQTDDAEQKTSR